MNRKYEVTNYITNGRLHKYRNLQHVTITKHNSNNLTVPRTGQICHSNTIHYK